MEQKNPLTFSLTEQEVQLPKDVNEISTNTFIEQQQTKKTNRWEAHHRGWGAPVEGDGALEGVGARLRLID